MNQFDQHNAMMSLEQALVPTAGLVDSRTEADNLRLLVDFASLFNFYDRTNTINGNWSPFLLKDPVFLVASIAKTSFQKAYSLFINTCLQLEVALNKEINNTFISNAFNQLFDQLTFVFQTIERWTHYSQESSIDYNLKTYIVTNVTNTYSLILWSLLELRQQLFNYGNSPEGTVINIPDIQDIHKYAFEKYDKKIWKESKGKSPYWTVLGLPTSPCDDDENEQCFYISKLTQNDLFTALYSTGKKLFAFYSNCISYAETELESVQNVPGHFPDTILLRTFTSLLKIYQTQLNSLSEKHLNFYYGDILKQHPKSVSPDTVFACSDLAKKTATFQLPKSTIFTAGLDANKQAILFETTNTISLNPAKIASAYTLAIGNTDKKMYLQALPPVTEVKKDESGNIQQWKTFGSENTPIGSKEDLAIAFASPLFFLAEAKTRTIKLTFTLSDSNTSDLSTDNTACYLSTAKAWFPILKENSPITQDGSTVTLTITLHQTDPAITTFTKNPDGYTSDWPLLKLVFSNNQNLQNPTTIETLNIDVTVKELQNFALYNDFGMLNAKKPFQLLGPTPTVDQSFMIGSAEIFSKPVSDVKFHITWNTFPANFDFATYYCQYNNYAEGLYNKTVTSDTKEEDQANVICPKKITEIPAKVSLFDRIIGRKSATKTLSEATTGESDPLPQFTNDAFKVSFDFLENGLWNPVENEVTEQTLFTVDSNLNPERTFDFPSFKNTQTHINPALQQTPLVLTDKSTTGFLKMQLTGPDVGFGTAEYPNVVGAIALYNAGVIAVKIKKSSSKLVMIQPPNIPFIPTVSLFSGDYNASISYDFSNNDKTYPLECFYNTPFENYKVFDTVDGIITKNTTIGSSPLRDENGIITPLTALPLAPTFISKGQLFLELADVIAPAKVSFYFELARTYTEQAVTTNSVNYSYLSTDGWKTLTSIADGTNGFTCSGIITINIPKDITNDHETMTGTNFWIAIGAETSPDNFPQTSFLKTNGITLQRMVTSNDFSTVTPQIIADTITSPETAIPEISATIQPFASFGGKAAETNQQMNSRVSTRLKTKDRLVTAEDYFNVIRLEFPEVYYSKTIYTAKKASTYVIKRVSDATETNAFVPLLSECNELEIQNYIKERISPFVKVSVGNFKLNYVLIIADIQLQSDEDVTTVAKEINNAINIYLAPWITSAQSQITVDTGLNTAQLASFISSYDSVLEVNSISIQIVPENFNPKEIKTEDGKQEIPQEDGIILVPSLNNSTKNSLINYHL
jgi:hypothetical protein